MEYLSDGDLHKYLGSPLLEKEGKHIVFQILEGLHFMHDNGFAHRDLKPAVSLCT
jgi:calcium/calmodulin-dependent protein kinase I